LHGYRLTADGGTVLDVDLNGLRAQAKGNHIYDLWRLHWMSRDRGRLVADEEGSWIFEYRKLLRLLLVKVIERCGKGLQFIKVGRYILVFGELLIKPEY
jgi:hypothetical protein